MELNKRNFLIIDTGFFIALGNATDQFHHQAIAALDKLSQYRWVTTWPVLTETCHLLLQVSDDKPALFMKNYEEKAFEVFDLTHQHANRINILMDQYRKLPMDLADASLVILAEYLGHGTILSTDIRDFRTYKWKNKQPFYNLFESN